MFIHTQSSLSDLLRKYEVPIEEWGKGSSKTVRHLLMEISRGETQLRVENKSLIREVSALSIIVTHKDLILREDYQRFSDGRVRRRKMIASVAEKLDKDDKDPKSAVARGIREELGISISENQITEIEKETKNRISPSYPGLMSIVKLHRYGVELNEDQFIPEGYVEHQDDKSTFFIWISKDKKDS